MRGAAVYVRYGVSMGVIGCSTILVRPAVVRTGLPGVDRGVHGAGDLIVPAAQQVRYCEQFTPCIADCPSEQLGCAGEQQSRDRCRTKGDSPYEEVPADTTERDDRREHHNVLIIT